MAQNTLIYPSHYELMEELTNEQAGLLIKTIGRYQRGEDIIISDILVKGVWLGIKHDFDKQKETYEAVCERNQKNGKKGGRPKNPKNPSGLLKTQDNPNNLKDKDKDKDKDKKKYKAKDKNLVLATKQIEVKNSKGIMSDLQFNKIML
jgi:hypothetical protein